jgi:prophage antirepressor-like protein
MKDQSRISRAYSREFGSLDILMINDKLYFPATACARMLGYRNSHKAIREYCKGVNESFSPTAAGAQKKNVFLYGFLKKRPIPPKATMSEHQTIRRGTAWST